MKEHSYKINRVHFFLPGYLLWKHLKLINKISDDTAVLFLTENNHDWNQSLLKYVSFYKTRRGAKRIVIFHIPSVRLRTNSFNTEIQIKSLKEKYVRYIYTYFCIVGKSDIVFGYLDYPAYNNGRKILDDGKISMDELACLGYYNLRSCPKPDDSEPVCLM